MSWISNENIFIFSPIFNISISKKLIEKLKKFNVLIFSDFTLSDSLIDQFDKYYEKNNFYTKFQYNDFNVRTIYLGSKFTQSLYDLPDSITHLYLGCDFNKSIEFYDLKLILLSFGHKFNSFVNNLPITIEYLYFGYSFNQSVNYLPNNLKFISFGYLFNQSVENLPNSITHLYFSNHFSQPINNLINLNLKKLILSNIAFACYDFSKFSNTFISLDLINYSCDHNNPDNLKL